jgi:hypothetical protein
MNEKMIFICGMCYKYIDAEELPKHWEYISVSKFPPYNMINKLYGKGYNWYILCKCNKCLIVRKIIK